MNLRPDCQSKAAPGNTLGGIDDNNVLVSQHFFAFKLNKEDLIEVLKVLAECECSNGIKQPADDFTC